MDVDGVAPGPEARLVADQTRGAPLRRLCGRSVRAPPFRRRRPLAPFGEECAAIHAHFAKQARVEEDAGNGNGEQEGEEEEAADSDAVMDRVGRVAHGAVPGFIVGLCAFQPSWATDVPRCHVLWQWRWRNNAMVEQVLVSPSSLKNIG